MSFIADVGTAFQIIGLFIWINLFIFIVFGMMIAILGWLWYDWLLYPFRITVVHPTGIEFTRRARLVIDKNTKQKIMKVQHEPLHDGQPPDEKLFYPVRKGWLMTFTGVTAIKDGFGVLHWVDRTITSLRKEEFVDEVTKQKSVRYVQEAGIKNLVITGQNDIEQYLSSLGRAWRKWRMTPEKFMQMMFWLVLITALIMMAGLGVGFYEMNKMSQNNAGAAAQLANAMNRNNDLNEKMGIVLSLYGYNITKEPQGTQLAAPDNTQIITPFNNVVK